MYAELHARSAFSFLEGASLPEVLAQRAAQLGLPAVALLDRDSVSGAVRFHKACKKYGVKGLVGAEVTAEGGKFRYPLIVETRQGYQNLCRLLSKIKLEGLSGARIEDLESHSEGLICLTRGVEIEWIKLVAIFGKDNVFAEVQRHLHRDEEARNQADIARARSLGIPLLATNGVCHAAPEERELMDVLTCVRHKTTIEEAGRILARNDERYLKCAAQMKVLFADLPEALENAVQLASRIPYTLADLGYRFPSYPVPPGETMDSFLRRRVEEGARHRFRPYHERARQQIERELRLIEKLQLSGYFLIVWDIVEFCRKEGLLVQGRGSAANSAVCYVLGITACDPVKMELLFERFLSEERGEWPDIDLDLPSGDDREKVIQYVYQRYGRLGAAMTANVITYRGRSAIRDVGKVFGFDEETLGRLSKLASRGGWEVENHIREGNGPVRQMREAQLDFTNPVVARFLRIATEIQDLPRHLGQHSGGMVICEGQLDAVVPLQPATMPGRVVVQWDKDDCADMGIIKVDLLGLGMLAVLKDCLKLIRDHYKEEIELAHLPHDDPAVYKALQQADTVGMFQVESRAQMSCLPRMKPSNFYDVVVEVAIIRPGPIVGNMLHPYLRRRQGFEEPVSLHPLLDQVLKRTLGVPLFQEQLLRMAMLVADFTGGEAEELRRAMGFKRSEARMKEIEVRLRSGMNAKGITGETQEKIVQAITAFALYGFPESHAISFALIAYASAYLKCHYLAAFTAAILNNQPMGFYSPATLVKDAQRHGLRFKPVDVTKSDWLCTLEEHGGEQQVRLGFNYVKGFRELTAKALLEQRARRRFENIDDLARRVPVSKPEMKALAELGALNPIDGNPRHRRDALWQAELALKPTTELLAPGAAPEMQSPLRPMSPDERLYADFRNSGLTIGPHPIRYHRERLRQMKVQSVAELSRMPDGRLVRVGGVIICRQQPGTAKGFVFLSLEDETGIVNIILNPDLYQRERLNVLESTSVIVMGTLQNQNGSPSVRAGAVFPFDGTKFKVQSKDFC